MGTCHSGLTSSAFALLWWRGVLQTRWQPFEFDVHPDFREERWGTARIRLLTTGVLESMRQNSRPWNADPLLNTAVVCYEEGQQFGLCLTMRCLQASPCGHLPLGYPNLLQRDASPLHKCGMASSGCAGIPRLHRRDPHRMAALLQSPILQFGAAMGISTCANKLLVLTSRVDACSGLQRRFRSSPMEMSP